MIARRRRSRLLTTYRGGHERPVAEEWPDWAMLLAVMFFFAAFGLAVAVVAS